MSTHIEKVWTTRAGLPAVVVLTSMGFRCGYVGVAEGHPLFGVHYNDDPAIAFDVHGGITFSEKGNHPLPDSPLWWFGFDCGHYMDAPAPEFIEKWPSILQHMEGIHRTLDYCVDECESLADQIVKQVGVNPGFTSDNPGCGEVIVFVLSITFLAMVTMNYFGAQP